MAKSTKELFDAFLLAGFSREDARFFTAEVVKQMVASAAGKLWAGPGTTVISGFRILR